MKKNFLKIALLCATAACIMTGCQKESEVQPQANTEECQTTMLRYAVDGQWYTLNIASEQELRDLLTSLTQLAQQGHTVQIDQQEQGTPSKDTVEFETKDEDEFVKWNLEMLYAGYCVTMWYDEETGIIHGRATKK